MPDTDRSSSPSLVDRLAETHADLSASHRKVADFIMGQPFRAAMMGIEELAGSADVSVATVNRFARRLGYGGYAEFRAASMRPFRRTMAPVEKLRSRKEHPVSAYEIMRETYRGLAANLSRSEHLLVAETCEAAAAAILRARRVVVLAHGIAAPLARLAGDLLEPYCATIEVLDGRGGPERMVRRVMRLGAGDLLIALTLPRYSRMTIDLLRSAREQGARTLGLTDGPNSPIVPLCDLSLFGASEHGVLHGSCIGLLMLAEGLAAVLAQRQQTVEDAAELTNRILPHLFAEDADLARKDVGDNTEGE